MINNYIFLEPSLYTPIIKKPMLTAHRTAALPIIEELFSETITTPIRAFFIHQYLVFPPLTIYSCKQCMKNVYSIMFCFPT